MNGPWVIKSEVVSEESVRTMDKRPLTKAVGKGRSFYRDQTPRHQIKHMNIRRYSFFFFKGFLV